MLLFVFLDFKLYFSNNRFTTKLFNFNTYYLVYAHKPKHYSQIVSFTFNRLEIPEKFPTLPRMINNPIDLILGCALAYGAIQGFRKGLLVELASMAALVLGLWGAFLLADWAKEILQDHLALNPAMLTAASYLVVFIGIVLSISILAKALTKIISLAALGLVNRLLGSAFGVLKMGLILSALLIIVHRINFLITFIEPEWLASSFLYEPVRELGSFIFDWVMETDTMALPGWS